MLEVGIGIAGPGTVGGGVLSILRAHATDIEARLGARLVVWRVAVGDPGRRRALPIEADLRAAIAEIDRDPTTLAPSRLIRIEAV